MCRKAVPLGTFHCDGCTWTHCNPVHPEKAKGPLPTKVESDLTPPKPVIAALLRQSIEPTSVLTFGTASGIVKISLLSLADFMACKAFAFGASCNFFTPEAYSFLCDGSSQWATLRTPAKCCQPCFGQRWDIKPKNMPRAEADDLQTLPSTCKAHKERTPRTMEGTLSPSLTNSPCPRSRA